jgi:hypothetical protein|tara:strand:+ start:3401 stop:3820 length:420 start_codon:yes stop_codon:yes gene_type:complete
MSSTHEEMRREVVGKYRRKLEEQRKEWLGVLSRQRAQQLLTLDQRRAALDCSFQQELVEWRAELTARITRAHEQKIAALRTHSLNREREEASVAEASATAASSLSSRSSRTVLWSRERGERISSSNGGGRRARSAAPRR